MSSVTSIESDTSHNTLRPWQFFLLAGMLSATAVVIVATGQSAASIIILSLTVVASSLVALGVYRVLAPLVVAEHAEMPSLIEGRTRASLEREKTLVLRSIKELEFDFAMGKIAKNDFDEMSARLRSRAIRLMRQLDEGGGYRTVIERELQSRMGAPTAIGAATERAAVRPSMDASVRGAAQIAGAECASCGVTNDPDARFCKNCGSRLHEP